jgi:hypothetical protein
MESEIPQLQVITAISDADCEDFVSQLLFSQGWSIIFRAIDMSGLTEFLESRGGALRTIIIYKSDLPGFDVQGLQVYLNSKVTQICIDSVEINSHKLMTHIRSQLRFPLIVSNENIFPNYTESSAPTENLKISKPCVITITGTAGAPGRSSVALNLANYLALDSKVCIYDADNRAPALEYLLGRAAKNNRNLELVNVASQAEMTKLKIADLSHISVVDIGSLPPISEVVNDRRWQAGFINRTLEETSTLIYICKSNGLSLIRLEQFMSQFPILLRKLPIIYILNQSGSSREDRALANRFEKMCDGEISFVLPANSRINTDLVEPSKRQSGFGKAISDIGRIAQEVN